MSEVINLSLSQRSNHVITHLYNNQESHIPYQKNAKVNHNNAMFLSTSKNGNHTNYSPRALLYDLKGGFGALNKYEYHEAIPNFDHITKQQTIESYNSSIPKNQYQINLDKGIKSDDILNEANTMYWSDYNKLIYNPKSLFTLENYVHPQDEGFGVHKHFANLKFSKFNVGSEEFKNNDLDDQLDRFRFYLEQCDLFQGLNVFSEVDSGWGGYTNSLLETIVDEYFNSGISNSKHNLWIYGLFRGTGGKNGFLDTNQCISRIKSLVELSKNSTLFFPLNIQPDSSRSSLITSEYNHNSLWHSSSLPSMFVDSIWGIQNQLQGSKTMSVIEDNLLRGVANRKFVNDIKIHQIQDNLIGNLISDVNIGDYFNLAAITTTPQKVDFIDLSIPGTVPSVKKRKTHDPKYFVTNHIIPSGSNFVDTLPKDGIPSNIYESQNIGDIIQVDSFPNKILSKGRDTKYYTEFNINTKFRDELKLYKQLISNIRPAHEAACTIVEEKEELIEDIDRILEEYTIGYDDSEESSDDDY